MGKDSKSSDEESKPVVAKTALELQRFKLAKLMNNPERPVVIPDRLKEKKMPHVPEFVRNVMGSSAGAGSGEFHVYRHLRRKEYARQKFIQEKSEKQLLEEAYHQKLLDNKQAAEEKTAKKRAKRLKKKAKRKIRKANSEDNPVNNAHSSKGAILSEDESESESEKEGEPSEVEFQNDKSDKFKESPCKNEIQRNSDKEAILNKDSDTNVEGNIINIDISLEKETVNNSVTGDT